jgi:hypothetical protein
MWPQPQLAPKQRFVSCFEIKNNTIDKFVVSSLMCVSQALLAKRVFRSGEHTVWEGKLTKPPFCRYCV